MTLLTADLVAPAAARYRLRLAERAATIGAWADEHVTLPRGSGPIPHDQTITPYWRHWLALVQGRVAQGQPVQRLVLVTGTQVGKTFGFLAPTLAWIVAVHPRDVALVLPSDDVRKKAARDKFLRVFRGSDRLAGLLPHGRAAAEKALGLKAWLLADLTVHFLNGSIAMDLRSADLPVILADEFDALPHNVQGEGSPHGLMRDRMKTFPDQSLLAEITTPSSVDGLGWQSLCAGTHERLHVACQACGAQHILDPDRLRPLPGVTTPDQAEVADAVHWHCPTCEHGHDSDARDAMVAAACAVDGFTAAGGWIPGQWQQHADGTHAWQPAAQRDAQGRIVAIVPATAATHRSGWLNSLYSRAITLSRFWAEDQRSRAGSATDRQAFVNGWRAEPYFAQIDAPQAADLTRVIGDGDGYQLGQCPHPCQYLILSCDQQGITREASWFPWILRAFAPDGRSWLVDCGKAGDPKTGGGFEALTALTTRTWPVAGAARAPDVTCLDAGNGQMLPDVRAWCAKDQRRRVSIQGSGTMGEEYTHSEINANAKNNHRLYGLVRAYVINSQFFRNLLYERIRGAGHVPPWHIAPDAPAWYRDSLASEERIGQDTVIRGRPVQRLVWVPRRWVDSRGTWHERTDNHWFDAEVQALALTVVLRWFTAQTPRLDVTPRRRIAR